LKYFIGVTDGDWFRFLGARKPAEVNFWRPSADRPVARLEYGAPFLFKLHKPLNAIVGGGFFAGFQPLAVSQAWDAFGESNGAASAEEVRTRVLKYRRSPAETPRDPLIGCTVLVEPFFFEERDWVEAPRDWRDPIVVGKGYDTADPIGREVWERVALARLGQQVDAQVVTDLPRRAYDGPVLGRAYLRKARLGQGAFRLLTAKNYHEKCCITAESTVPVLEAAHIRPVTQEGDHALSNGLLMRADMHILYDRGLIGVDPDYRIRVSGQIREQYLNGRAHYRHDGEPLRSLPEDEWLRPDRDLLAWHMETVFVR
jgi:putative restriction endonuclease